MKRPNREEQKQLVKQWGITGRILEEMRREKLRGKPYDWREANAVLQLGENAAGVSRSSEGIIEMQRLFMLAAEKLRGKES